MLEFYVAIAVVCALLGWLGYHAMRDPGPTKGH